MRSATARAMAPPARRPLTGNGWSRMPHSIYRLSSVLTYGAFVLLQLIEAYTHEGDQPPEQTHNWWDDADFEVDWLEYWMGTTGLDERAGWKALAELKQHRLVDVEGAGRRANFRTRPEQYLKCRPREPRGGWTRMPPGVEEASVTEDRRAALRGPVTPSEPQPAKLDCPHGLPCPVSEVVEINGVFRNTQVVDSSTGSKDSLNSSSAKQKRNLPAESPKPEDNGAEKCAEKWDGVKVLLKAKLTPVTYANWVEGTEFVESHQGIAVVEVPDESTKAWLGGEPELMAGPLAAMGLAGVKYVVVERREASGEGKRGSAPDGFRAQLQQLCVGRSVVIDEKLTKDLQAVLHTPEKAFLTIVAKPHVWKKIDSDQFLFCLALQARHQHVKALELSDRLKRAAESMRRMGREYGEAVL